MKSMKPSKFCFDLDGTLCYTRVEGEHYRDVKPITGKLLIFSNREYLHHVSEVESGTRYILSFWFNAYVSS